MSTLYQSSKDVPTEVLSARLNQLSDVVSSNRERIDAEFTMRIPAEADRDADLVMSESAVRLVALQAECERLYAALRHMASMYGVDDYFSGKLRDKEIDRAVNSALESVMPTCKRDKKPCGKAGGYCLECPSGPRREWLSK